MKISEELKNEINAYNPAQSPLGHAVSMAVELVLQCGDDDWNGQFGTAAKAVKSKLVAAHGDEFAKKLTKQVGDRRYVNCRDAERVVGASYDLLVAVYRYKRESSEMVDYFRRG